MLIGVPKEIKPQEFRTAITPAMVRAFVDAGHSVVVEGGAGAMIGYSDELYIAAGAAIASSAKEVYKAEMVLKVKEPQKEEYLLLREGQILFCYLHLAPNPKLTEILIEKGVIAIAYETVTDKSGGLPLLKPMSEIAGRIAIQAGTQMLQMNNGGNGILLGGVPGVLPAKVVIIGAGSAGTESARMAFGLGAEVVVLDVNLERLRYIDAIFGHRLKTLYSSAFALESLLPSADLVVGTVLVHGKVAPKVITREMVKKMIPGSAVVDVAIDQGGCLETSRPTTHQNPTYVEEGVNHYCVTNMPGACARTSTEALTNATMAYALKIANLGVKRALMEDPHLQEGLNVCSGKVTCAPVAADLGYDYSPPEKVVPFI